MGVAVLLWNRSALTTKGGLRFYLGAVGFMLGIFLVASELLALPATSSSVIGELGGKGVFFAILGAFFVQDFFVHVRGKVAGMPHTSALYEFLGKFVVLFTATFYAWLLMRFSVAGNTALILLFVFCRTLAELPMRRGAYAPKILLGVLFGAGLLTIAFSEDSDLATASQGEVLGFFGVALAIVLFSVLFVTLLLRTRAKTFTKTTIIRHTSDGRTTTSTTTEQQSAPEHQTSA